MNRRAIIAATLASGLGLHGAAAQSTPVDDALEAAAQDALHAIVHEVIANGRLGRVPEIFDQDIVDTDEILILLAEAHSLATRFNDADAASFSSEYTAVTGPRAFALLDLDDGSDRFMFVYVSVDSRSLLARHVVYAAQRY